MYICWIKFFNSLKRLKTWGKNNGYRRNDFAVDFAIFRFLMKLLQTNNKEIINDCCSFFNFKLPSERIHNRKKSDLIRHTIRLEVIEKCLRPVLY